MSTSSEPDLQSWIAMRRQDPSVDLASPVMKAIQDELRPATPASESHSPSWLVAFGCLLAGVGKVSLVCYLAF